MMKQVDRAIQLMKEQKAEEAITLIDQALPNMDEDMKYAIANWYKELGFLQNANEILESLLLEKPNELDFRFELIDNYLELGQDEKALNIIHEISITDPEDPDYLPVLIQQADLYQAQGLFEVAEEKLLTAKRENPNEKILDVALAELLFAEGEFKKSIVYYKILIDAKFEIEHINFNERLTEAYASAGEYEKALDIYKDIDLDNDAKQLFNYGLTAYQANENDLAIKNWEQALEIDESLHAVYGYLAQAYEKDGLIEDAYTMCKRGLTYDEHNKELFLLTAKYANILNDLATAETYLRDALVIDPEYEDALILLSEMLKLENRNSEIIELIEYAQEYGSINPSFHSYLAAAHVENENYSEALNHYEVAYNILDDDADFLKEYGYFLIEEGDMKKGIEILQNYLTLEQDDEETIAFITRLTESN